MRKTIVALVLSAVAVTGFAGDQKDGKSCDTHRGKSVSLSGKVSCTSSDDCTFQSADAKTTYTVCEMSKADLPKLSASGATLNVKGSLITCAGKEKLVIEHVSEQ